MNVPTMITYPARLTRDGWLVRVASCQICVLKIMPMHSLSRTRLREANRVPSCDFFEGAVMKRAESAYPIQPRSTPEECRVG